MKQNHLNVEAVLFALGKEVSVEEIASICKIEPSCVKEIVFDLQKRYNEDNSNSLIINNNGDFYKFSVKDKFLPLVSSLVQNTELDKSTMETLAVIAWKNPVTQAEIIKIRNAKAYDHLKNLKERNFIVREKSGRTYKIRLTQKFFEYFDIPSENAKEAFKNVLPKEVSEEIEEHSSQ